VSWCPTHRDFEPDPAKPPTNACWPCLKAYFLTGPERPVTAAEFLAAMNLFDARMQILEIRKHVSDTQFRADRAMSNGPEPGVV